jgi:hypothetical protein
VYVYIVAGDPPFMCMLQMKYSVVTSAVLWQFRLFVPPKIMSMSQIRSHSPFYNELLHKISSPLVYTVVCVLP